MKIRCPGTGCDRLVDIPEEEVMCRCGQWIQWWSSIEVVETNHYKDNFTIGDHVEKTGGDYRFDGVVVARVVKLSGQVRYVVEDGRGLLFIFNPGQLRRVPGGEVKS